MSAASENARRRQKYQKLMDVGNEINDSIEGEDLIKTLTKVKDLAKDGDQTWNERGEEARNPSEVVMDIQVLKMNHELISKSIRTKGMSDFHDDEFINALKEILVDSSGVWHWDKMLPIWGKQMKVASCLGFPLLGAFGEIPAEKEKVVKQRAKRARNTLTEEKKPENVSKLKAEQKSSQKINDTYKQITRIYEQRQRKDIPFFELVCDPDSFMATIDNIFHVSFLTREGLLTLRDNETDEGFPLLRPKSKQTESQVVKDTTQTVSSINTALWKKCIAKYKIKHPLLKSSQASTASPK
ncbi:uncharacterized protein LOC129805560 [Phlebotomus papatasi]|uniref:uncharacterized protein LOC129805560 n=1 Tax=Phlebotomus papatasi TaxID=29031 RepID=UPI0024833B49|nr:uncharacterized protein LOC129805560 [Phlebotomus papatasi]XP_055709530.1 uncharacterized protein LOC129805560 [Phlebotomus papatasi]